MLGEASPLKAMFNKNLSTLNKSELHAVAISVCDV